MVRSSLSRGPADLVGCYQGLILLVQVKRGKDGLNPEERHRLVDAAKQAGGLPILALYQRYKGVRWFIYTGYDAGDRKPYQP